MGLYLYAIREIGGNKIRARGIDNAQVFSVPYKKIEAIVSNVDSKKFGSKEIAKRAKEDIAWIVKHAKIHEKVLEASMCLGTQNYASIPMVFGTIFKTQKKLEEVLKKEYNRFNGALQKLSGKQEWSVKVYVDEKALKNSLKKRDKSILSQLDALKTLPLGVDYFEELAIDEKLDESLAKEHEKYLKIFIKSLKLYSTDSFEGKILAKEMTGKESEMLLNSANLVKEEKVNDFKKAVDKLKRINSAFKFECTGPWPPYNFV
jgi:hypothetical protein